MVSMNSSKARYYEIDISVTRTGLVTLNNLLPIIMSSFLMLLVLYSPQDFAVEVIRGAHEHWRALVQKQSDGGGISW